MRRLYVLSSITWGVVELLALQRSRLLAWRQRVCNYSAHPAKQG